MKAVVFHGKEDFRVDSVLDPTIQEPTDAVIKVTSTAICGSDLHLYSRLHPALKEGDILGHEPMGVVEAVGSGVTHIAPGDRVVIPFNIACGACAQCGVGMHSQCETTQNRTTRKGADLFGYTHLYGGVDGGQAEYLRVPQAQFGPVKVPDGPPDQRFLYLSDVLPTAWQAVQYAAVPPGGTVAVLGLGPVGQMCVRVAFLLGAGRVIGVDCVPERLALAEAWGAETVDFSAVDDVTNCVFEMTDGRLCESVIDAVGMEASGSIADSVLSRLKLQPDKLVALHHALGVARRGGTVSIIGVYVGAFPMFPLGDLFDKQITIRQGQANVKRWMPDLLPLVSGEEDPLGVDGFATHTLPLEQAAEAYEMFQKKQDGCVKVVLTT